MLYHHHIHIRLVLIVLITACAGPGIAGVPAADARTPLIHCLTGFCWGYTVTPVVLPQILAANGRPAPDIVQLNPEWHRTADELGQREDFQLPRLGDFLAGSIDAPTLVAGLGEKYKRHGKRLAKSLTPYAGQQATLLILDVNTQFHYRRGGRNDAASSRKRTVAALGDLVSQVTAAGTRVLLYVDGGKRIDVAWRRTRQRGDPKQARSIEDDANDLAAIDTAALAARDLGIPVIPVHRAYARLRREHPDFPLTAFLSRRAHGTHPLNYLNACVTAAVILDRRPDLPTAAGREAIHQAILAGYAGNARELKRKRGIETPPPAFTEQQLNVLHDVAWGAVEEIRQVLADAGKETE